MKKITILSLLIVLFVAGIWIAYQFIFCSGTCEIDNTTGFSKHEQPLFVMVKKPEKRNEKGIKGAVAYLSAMRANQHAGNVSLEDVYNSRRKYYQTSQSTLRSSSLNLRWESMGPDNVGGRTRAILIDKNNPGTMYAGGVSGGLYVSYNGGLTWEEHPFTGEEIVPMGVSTMAQAPNGDIYLGSGESFTVSNGTNNSSAFIGEGIFKSTDGGHSFFKLTSTDPMTPNSQSERWAYINELAVDPVDAQKIYAATNKGLMISSDGGNAWQEATLPNPNDNNSAADDVAVAADGTVHASISRRYYRSKDGGLTFELLSGINNFPSTNIGRKEFAISPQDPHYIYCLISKSTDQSLRGVWKSINGGDSWTLLVSGDISGFNPLGEQGRYDMVIAVDPGDKTRIFIGGQLSFWSYSPSQNWNMLGFWSPESYNNPYYIHADMHKIVFHPTDRNIMYVGTDGGVFQSTNASQNFPTFTIRNKGYNVTQFYAATASITGELLGGTQDNGTRHINYQGNTEQFAFEPKGGDGGDVAFSWKKPEISFAEYVYASVERSTDGAQDYNPFFDTRIDPDGNHYPGEGEGRRNALFIAPFEMWEPPYPDPSNYPANFRISRADSLHGIFFLGGVFASGNGNPSNGRLWMTPDATNISRQARWYQLNGIGTPTAIGVSTEGIVYLGSYSGVVYRVDGLDTSRMVLVDDTIRDNSGNIVSIDKVNYNPVFDSIHKYSPTVGNILPASGVTRTVIGTFPGRYVTSVTVDPFNADRVVITLGNYGNSEYVYFSENARSGSPTWISVQGDLPEMPVYGAVIDYINNKTVVLGTELGIWATDDVTANPVVWTHQNNGIPGVPVFTIRQDPLNTYDCRQMIAGTYGKGIYRSTSLMTSFCPTILVTGDNVQSAGQLQLSFYPNPVRHKAFLDIELDETTNVHAQAFTVLGRKVKDLKLGKAVRGANKYELDLSGLNSGSYLLYVTAGNEKRTLKFMVAN